MVINCNGILKEDDSLIKSKIILVTGGLGFIGSHFIKLLLNEKNKYKIVNVDVETYVKNNGGVVKSMIRYEVGEGMEKRSENFAEEVAKQING